MVQPKCYNLVHVIHQLSLWLLATREGDFPCGHFKYGDPTINSVKGLVIGNAPVYTIINPPDEAFGSVHQSNSSSIQ